MYSLIRLTRVLICPLAFLASCGTNETQDYSDLRARIQATQSVEVIYLGDKGGDEDDRTLVTFTPKDARFSTLVGLVVSSVEAGEDPNPKAPHLDDGLKFVFTRQGDAIRVVLHLDSLEVDGIFFRFEKNLELTGLFRSEIEQYHRK